jgi:hypothetical protein
MAHNLPFTSLDAATSPGAGSVRDLEGSLFHHTVLVWATGEPSAVRVDFYGSHDGDNWFNFGNTTGAPLSVDRVVRYVRADLTTLTGGTSPALTATIASA